MSNEITLLHIVRRHGDQVFYFYDGQRTAHDGLLKLPADREPWIRRAWISGYRLTPDGKPLNVWSDVLAEIERQSTKSTEDNKSVEDTSAGRQSEAGDRVRASESSSSASAKPSRASSPSRGSADNGKAKAKGK